MNTLTLWKREKKVFLKWITILALLFYLSLPLGLAIFPEVMKMSPVGSLSWAWIYAFLQVIMTWIIGWIYWCKAKRLDELVAQMRQEDTQ